MNGGERRKEAERRTSIENGREEGGSEKEREGGEGSRLRLVVCFLA